MWLTRPRGPNYQVLVLNTERAPILSLLIFSNYLKMKRYAGWVLRFINVKVRGSKVTSSELTAAEIEAGEKLICRQVQM